MIGGAPEPKHVIPCPPKKLKEEEKMSPENARRFYETIARIISEREKVKVTVKVRERQVEEKARGVGD